MRPIRLIAVAVVLLTVCMLVFAAGFASHYVLSRWALLPASITALDTASANSSGPTDTFAQAWRLVEQYFLGDLPSPEKRTYGAVQGMLATLGDPYTVFVEPQPRQLERDQLRGEFGGIGVNISKADSGEIILRPMPGLAAEQAGVQDGDILVAVDGNAIATETTLDEVAVQVRGEIGTTVDITVRRDGVADPLTFTVRRQRIEDPSVAWRMLEQAPDVGYIAIRIFSERTARELIYAINELKAQGAQSLVLDLRHNPGGMVEAAIDVTSQFLAEGVVFIQKMQNGQEIVQEVRAGGMATEMPLIVLVDRGTASASEIVSGALQDSGRAQLVGERTFGKGSVQTVLDLEDGSSVHITTARWYSPSRRLLDGQGLEPDIAVAPATQEQAAAGTDPVLEAALAALQASQ